MLKPIMVFPPSERSKEEGSILKPDKYVAMMSGDSPYGPFGFGDTQKEAVDELRAILHKALDDMPCYECNDRGVTGDYLDL